METFLNPLNPIKILVRGFSLETDDFKLIYGKNNSAC